MKVIFLDVDGVLACERSRTDEYKEDDPDLIQDPRDKAFVRLERAPCRNLGRLCEATGAKIVVSSTWRVVPSQRNFLVSTLTSGEFGKIEVIGDTPNIAGGWGDKPAAGSPDNGRGAEIATWLKLHDCYADRPEEKIEAFVILDDDHFDSFEKNGLMKHVVKCVLRSREDRSLEGLTEEKMNEAIAKLNGS